MDVAGGKLADSGNALAQRSASFFLSPNNK